VGHHRQVKIEVISIQNQQKKEWAEASGARRSDDSEV
jgi:hypothetical protein